MLLVFQFFSVVVLVPLLHVSVSVKLHPSAHFRFNYPAFGVSTLV